MYSRLYTSVLNQHYAVDFCSAFHHCYLDSGLFGISLTVHPSFVPQMAALLATQFDNVTRVTRGGIVQADLNRAKNQLKSGLAMSLESRIMQVEDLGVSPRLPTSLPAPPCPISRILTDDTLIRFSDKSKYTATKFQWKKCRPSSMP